jgi:hypothetical protein
VPVRAQGHVEQHEQANRHRVEDQASHARSHRHGPVRG